MRTRRKKTGSRPQRSRKMRNKGASAGPAEKEGYHILEEPGGSFRQPPLPEGPQQGITARSSATVHRRAGLFV